MAALTWSAGLLSQHPQTPPGPSSAKAPCAGPCLAPLPPPRYRHGEGARHGSSVGLVVAKLRPLTCGTRVIHPPRPIAAPGLRSRSWTRAIDARMAEPGSIDLWNGRGSGFVGGCVQAVRVSEQADRPTIGRVVSRCSPGRARELVLPPGGDTVAGRPATAAAARRIRHRGGRTQRARAVRRDRRTGAGGRDGDRGPVAAPVAGNARPSEGLHVVLVPHQRRELSDPLSGRCPGAGADRGPPCSGSAVAKRRDCGGATSTSNKAC